ncbi:MAG: DUF4974 domain-containing protein [Cyclobacteriaceae bacterium]|nr:DUF4974 domain-containing protein [Cyclobacteriaceae bacterium]
MDRVTLMYKVLSGKASPVEKLELNDWIALNPENEEEFKNIKLLWESEQDTGRIIEQDTNDNFEQIRLRVKSHQIRIRTIRSILYTLVVLSLALFAISIMHATGSGTTGYRFEEVAMTNVIRVLEKRYYIKVEVRNPELLRCRYTGSFFRVEDEREVLRSIEQALEVEFVALTDTQYQLTGNVCAGY